jgi:hypothetical protein
MTEVEDRLMVEWKMLQGTQLWSFFGGVITLDGQRWQVIPMGDDKPVFKKL